MYHWGDWYALHTPTLALGGGGGQPTPFYFVLVSVSVFMALSTVFHSMNSPHNSPLSHSALPVLFLPYWSLQLYISLCESLLQPWYNPFVVDWA